MPSWPNIDRVEDQRLVQALLNGESDALAQVFDRYASRLYDYCHALLRDQESAADALHDGLLAAQAHIGRLHEPELFRGWLYAVVRGECLRRLNDPERPIERREARDAEETFRNAEEAAQRHETRLLVHSALSALSGRQREAVDLVLRHDLDVRELARVVGVTPAEATELTGQAHGVLDEALVAALTARTGRDACGSVAALVDAEEWPLNADVSGKLVRHIATCPTCHARRARVTSTAELLHVLPVALMPVDLGWELLNFASAPDRAEERATIARWAEPFDERGWPVTESSEPPPHRTRNVRPWPAIAAAACVIAVVAAAFLWLPHPSGQNSGAAPPVATSGTPEVSDPAVSVSPSESAADSPEPTPTISTSTPAPRPTTTRPRPRPSTTKPTTKPPAAGTLAISGNPDFGRFRSEIPLTLTAVGGPVDWSASPGGNLSVSGGDRSLAAGDSTEVTVTLDRPFPCDSDGSSSITFSPGGKAFPMTWKCPGN